MSNSPYVSLPQDHSQVVEFYIDKEGREYAYAQDTARWNDCYPSPTGQYLCTYKIFVGDDESPKVLQAMQALLLAIDADKDDLKEELAQLKEAGDGIAFPMLSYLLGDIFLAGRYSR